MKIFSQEIKQRIICNIDLCEDYGSKKITFRDFKNRSGPQHIQLEVNQNKIQFWEDKNATKVKLCTVCPFTTIYPSHLIKH